jgi:hypothetical protein
MVEFTWIGILDVGLASSEAGWMMGSDRLPNHY